MWWSFTINPFIEEENYYYLVSFYIEIINFVLLLYQLSVLLLECLGTDTHFFIWYLTIVISAWFFFLENFEESTKYKRHGHIFGTEWEFDGLRAVLLPLVALQYLAKHVITGNFHITWQPATQSVSFSLYFAYAQASPKITHQFCLSLAIVGIGQIFIIITEGKFLGTKLRLLHWTRTRHPTLVVDLLSY